jgi:acetolactate synthase I/II/III large subunit
MTKRVSIESVAEAYLELLATRGVDYFFANAGTDFAPLIEAYAKRLAEGHALPRPLTVPHEAPAVAMAHGYAMITGRPQAVMVHVIVGGANALGGVINAARANVPILMTAGRTPLTESGLPGSRDRQIHWAQESFDQGTMFREWVKWDYELRNFAQLETVVDRALAVACTEPQGPVYLALPREVLAERQEVFEYSESSRAGQPSPLMPDPTSIEAAARLLAGARFPLVIARAAGRDPEAVSALVQFAEVYGAAVVENFHTYLNFPQDHPLHAGFDTATDLEAADVIVVLESDAPWFPDLKRPSQDARFIHIGVDPLYARYPIRSFPCDIALGGLPRLALSALADAGLRLRDGQAVAERRARWAEESARRRTAQAEAARRVQNDSPIDMLWLSRAISQILGDDTIVVNEYDLQPSQTCFRHPGRYFAAPASSGLGWGLGAALGVKLAAPEKTVICTVGDGAYIFGAPTAAHFVARAYDLPVLFVVFNNRAWNAVKRSVRSYAPQGWAARTGLMPLSDLDPAPDYERICQANGGYGERVEDPAALPLALERALRAVRHERRQALLNVICKKPA